MWALPLSNELNMRKEEHQYTTHICEISTYLYSLILESPSMEKEVERKRKWFYCSFRAYYALLLQLFFESLI